MENSIPEVIGLMKLWASNILKVMSEEELEQKLEFSLCYTT